MKKANTKVLNLISQTFKAMIGLFLTVGAVCFLCGIIGGITISEYFFSQDQSKPHDDYD